MTPFEIALNLGSVALAGAGIAYVTHVIRISGHDRQEDPALVTHLVETAPYERLDNVLSK